MDVLRTLQHIAADQFRDRRARSRTIAGFAVLSFVLAAAFSVVLDRSLGGFLSLLGFFALMSVGDVTVTWAFARSSRQQRSEPR